MKTIIRHLSLLSFMLICKTAISQEEEKTNENGIQFKIGSFYNSHLNYYGRTDSLRSSGFFPLAEIWFNNSLYVNAAPVFVSNAASSFAYAGTVATAGYQAKSKDEKFLTHIFFTKPFYQAGSQLVQSALKEQLSASVSWQNKLLNVTGGVDAKHSSKIDFGLSAGLDHLFRHQLENNLVLIADPSATVNAGTQQFTKTYYEKKSFLIFPGSEQAVDRQVNRMNVLSYELSVPVILSDRHWQIIVIPAYVIPQNLVTVADRPDLSERGRSMFYVTAGAKFIF